MFIKQATVNDVKTISEIHASSWKEYYKELVPQQYLDELKDDFWEEAFKSWFEKNIITTQIAFENNLPVGCITYGKSRDEKFSDWGEIISIYLVSGYAGKGYGKALLDTALSDMLKMEYKNIYLWVLKDNQRATNFYEKNGFTCNGDLYEFEIMGKALQDVRYILNTLN